MPHERANTGERTGNEAVRPFRDGRKKSMIGGVQSSSHPTFPTFVSIKVHASSPTD